MQLAGTAPMPRSERDVATAGSPSSNVSMVFSCTPLPARLISGTTRPLSTNAMASGTRPTKLTRGCRDRRSAGMLPAMAIVKSSGEMRDDLAQKPFEADAVGLPGPRADQRRVVSRRPLAGGHVSRGRRDERQRSGLAGSFDAERGAVLVGKREHEFGLVAEAALEIPEQTRLPAVHELLDRAVRRGSVFLGRAELDIVRDEDRRLVVEQSFERAGQRHRVEDIAVERLDRLQRGANLVAADSHAA